MRVGLAALLAVSAAAMVIVLAQSPDQRTVTAEFTDVRGLVAGAQVRLAGVPVGQVERVWLGRDGWPQVTMSVESDVSPARAAVRMASLSGEFNRYVSIVQGSRTAFIPRSQTTSPVEVDQALSTFDPATERELHGALDGLRAALAGRGPALAQTLRTSQAMLGQLGGLAQDLAGDGAELQLALRSSAVIASSLARSDPALGQAVGRSTDLMNTLAGRAAALRTGLSNLPGSMVAAQGTLTRARALIAPAERLVRLVTPAVRRLPVFSTELRDALVASTPTLRRAATVATTAPPAAAAMLPVLRAAGPLLGVLTPVLRRLGPMLDELRVRFPDAYSFFSNWADFTSNFDANGHGARVGIVIPPAPTNKLSPSGNGAGQLAPPYLRTPGSLEGQPWKSYRKSFVAGGPR